MDRNDNSDPNAPLNGGEGSSTVLISNLLLENVGEVVLTHNSDGLSWKSIDSITNEQPESCLCVELILKHESSIRFSDIFAVEFIDWGLVHDSALTNSGGCFMGYSSEMYRFSVHFVQKSKTHQCLWVPSLYTFGHKDSQTCQMWVDRINTLINLEADRPKSLLVFVHPRSGKGNGNKSWEAVAPIFSHAKVKTKVIVTQRAGHASDVMASITNRELNSYDGIVAVGFYAGGLLSVHYKLTCEPAEGFHAGGLLSVHYKLTCEPAGGDGFFGEILNGLLLSRHKTSYPPCPTDADDPVEINGTVHVAEGTPSGSSGHCEDEFPLLNGSGHDRAQVTNLRTDDDSSYTEQDPEFSLPNERFRLGIIPAGSTDAIVICTTGARDPITSALQIVLGKRVRIDIAQVVRWKMTSTSKAEPCVRYAASFSGYGFYGDVIKESEKYRWMGPARYDYAGTKVFLRHSSYEAEVAYLEVEPKDASSSSEEGSWVGRKKGWYCLPKRSDRVPCRANCDVCNMTPIQTSPEIPRFAPYSQNSRWRRLRGRFLSVGAAVISCRNEKAPDGLVADAHLSDGFLNLILIKDCPRAFYLWHLTQLTRKGGHPLDFEFVEHHKTQAFTFTSFGKESVWNVDGELFQAHQLSAQVFRGLVSLFATGPDV